MVLMIPRSFPNGFLVLSYEIWLGNELVVTIAPPDIHVPGGLFAVYSACESKPGPGPSKTVLGPETLSSLDFSN